MLHQAVWTQQGPLPGFTGGMVQRFITPIPDFASWEDAVRAGAPQTSADHDIWGVGQMFLPQVKDPTPRPFVLLWAGPGSKTRTKDALVWGDVCGFREVSPYEIFGLSHYFPHLYTRFGLEGAGLTATEAQYRGVKPHVCGLWQSENPEKGRLAQLVTTDLYLYDRTIFVFGED